MRVLHVSAYFAPAYCYGGPPRSILGLCLALIKSGLQVHVITSTADGDGELPDDVVNAGQFNGVPVTYLNRANPENYFYCPKMKSWLNSEISKFDIVHIHGCWNYMSWKAGSICRKTNTPYIISPRGMLESEALKISSLKKRIAYSLIERRQLKGSAYIHATSEKELSSINALNLGVPSVVIPNGIELAQCNWKAGGRLRQRFDIPDNDFVVLFVGRIHPIKGLEILCRAIRHLIRETPSIRLVLVGDGDAIYTCKLETDFRDLINSRNLFFTGHLEGEEKTDAYLSSNAFALMSYSENFGLAAAEAMSYRLPVILSKGCPWPQIVEWKAGYWVDSSVENVVEAIKLLETNREMAISMGQNAKDNITPYLDWNAIAQKMEELYKETLSG